MLYLLTIDNLLTLHDNIISILTSKIMVNCGGLSELILKKWGFEHAKMKQNNKFIVNDNTLENN